MKLDFLKSLMTQKDLQIRKPYGYFEEIYKRRSSFIGSVNKLEFLNDPSGSRRFLCFEVKKIEYDHHIDINKVYSQALHLFRKGEKYWFDQAEIQTITKNNQKFTFQPLEEQLILEKYGPCRKNDPERILLSATEIAQEIMGDRTINSSNVRQVGITLNKNGFVRGSVYNGKCSVKKWNVKRIIQREMEIN